MSQFIQLHVLTSYPPSNLNRDDLGRPKSATIGGATRLRISSQSQKRAWRTSDLFSSALKGHVGVRTKMMGEHVYTELVKKGVKDKQAHEWAGMIAKQFGELRGKREKANEQLHIEQLAHFGPQEQAAIDALVETLAQTQSAPTDEQLALLRGPQAAVDIALFGRMLAAKPRFNIEAAAQVAHAFTVHRADVDGDYYTAVDDLRPRDEDLGAGHIGETGFGAGVYYLYVCINRDLLDRNLAGDTELRNRALEALLQAITQVSPTGKQNSFASRAYASYVLAEKGDAQPRSLSLAFVKPMRPNDGDQVSAAVRALTEKCENMDKVYGPCAGARRSMNAETGEGSLKDITAFVQAD